MRQNVVNAKYKMHIIHNESHICSNRHDFVCFYRHFTCFCDHLDIDVHGLCLHTSLLLQFMEYLERHLYNAIEGCAVTMAPLPKVVTVISLCYACHIVICVWI